MWKNKRNIKNLIKIKHAYSIEGLNLDRFINSAKNKGIVLYNIKKISNKHLIVSVSIADSEKFFAIAKEMCYNIKKISEKGASLPLLKAWRFCGTVLGALIFAISSFVYNDYIYSISFCGSGSVYEREVLSYLNGRGIKPYVRFSNIDLERLEDEILSANKNLSFVSLTKQGNTLIVNSSLANNDVEKLEGNIYSLNSDVEGIIENIKVYRGTPQVEKGAQVKTGDLLVDGYMLIKEQSVKINIIATISIIVNNQIVYTSKNDNEEELASFFAQEQMCEKQILSTKVKKEKQEDKYVYYVEIQHRHIISVG